MNFPLILNLTGSVLVIIGMFMLPSAGVAWYYGERDLWALLGSALIASTSGVALYHLTRAHRRESFKNRDVFVVVTLSWLMISLAGAVPFMLTGGLPGITDAYFEAMSGFTTTGATVIGNIEALSRGLLFWRSMTHWVGGMGIILFALAVLPFLGAGGVQLFKAEVPELTVDKLRPRLIDTAKLLWVIYLSLTALAITLYMIGGMDWFDATCHAFATLGTGGFSTKNTSITYFDSAFIDYCCTILMFMAGINYTLYFYLLRGRFERFFSSSEFRFYVTVALTAILAVTLNNLYSSYDTVEESFRYASFQVVSIMSTTGFATADYELWGPLSQMTIIVLMFFGGMIGSTSGGMKQVRVLLMIKQGYRELYQMIHPRAVTTLKLDGKHLSKEILGSIWGFLFIFLFLCVLCTLLITITGVDIVTASATVVSTMCNVGPALGSAGPMDNYAALPVSAKWILIFCMLAGRLEVFTVVILFLPEFWKK